MYAIEITVICIVFAIVIFILCIFNRTEKGIDIASSYFEKNSLSVIIDPGHGGKDGGAISESGVQEKDLNLAISFAISDFLKLCDVEVIMTREDDSLVCDENDKKLKGKVKATDLKNRLAFSTNNPDSIFVSIHMNKFSVEKYNGLQVYYSKNNENSFQLAKCIQNNVKSLLQKDNNREVKAAGNNIYILDRIKAPAVLVECGFLSNVQETELLCDSSYRCKLALILSDSILTKLLNII